MPHVVDSTKGVLFCHAVYCECCPMLVWLAAYGLCTGNIGRSMNLQTPNTVYCLYILVIAQCVPALGSHRVGPTCLADCLDGS